MMQRRSSVRGFRPVVDEVWSCFLERVLKMVLKGVFENGFEMCFWKLFLKTD